MIESILYKTAIYCRLSLDDGSLGESGSIQTQKMMLEKYCRDNNFTIKEVYIDDGYYRRWSVGDSFNSRNRSRIYGCIWKCFVVIHDSSWNKCRYKCFSLRPCICSKWRRFL